MKTVAKFKVGDRLTLQSATVTVLTVYPVGCPKLKKETKKTFDVPVYEVKSDFSDDKPGEGWLVRGDLLENCKVTRPRTSKAKGRVS